MQTRTETLASLYQDGFFDIPSYQRSYSWEEPQLEDLIDDLRYLPEESNHFFGNIILDKKDEQYQTDRGRRFDVYDVVDGQQRLTTALILLHVAAQFDDVVDETVSEDNLIFPVDERPRLMPQDQDGEFFRDSLFGTASLECETPSQERLEYAKEYFESEFEDLPVREISERLRYDCKINVVEIDSDSEAASIFESLNDRGKPLSSLDKTKSFLMYMDDRSSNRGALETKIKQRFGSIYRELFVLSNGHDRVSDFDEDSVQRFHWGIYDGYDSDEYFNSLDTLKDRLREGYRNGEYDAVQQEIDEYTQNLREAASVFAALFNPSQRPDEVEFALNRLLSLGRVANVLPVLMAAQMEYGDDEPDKMADIVRACETLVFRVYATDGRRADTGRGKLVRLAHSIHSDDSYLFEDVLSRLDSITRIYTDDDRFERNLRDPEFYDSMSSQDIRYLLHHYGEQLGVDMHEEAQPDLERILSTDFEVEHILARELDEEHIPENLREDFEDNIHRLGNLTIASSYWNKSLSDLPFTEKKNAEGRREKEYKSSVLRVQQILATYEQFGRDEIEEREQQIIDFALDEWGIASEPQPSGGSSTDEGSDDVEYDSLPDSFFRRLTNRQEAFIRVLLEENDWIVNQEIRQRMENEYDLSSGGSRAVSGILSGFTRKYSNGFTWNLVNYRTTGRGTEYRLNPDSGYIEELRERLVPSTEES
ncbi:DUF262 domain-containing protein [Haloarcula argentinensis]|uniref:DUF262 domain-containing HNH endonuclease family protein n=1 Tax=Haloarcula argentinensis TaxID=43776 RepID=A0ABU2F189_HALAR|nr:DUF262 domain-containing protein [Haloarcula argentinensis]EMA19246.1 hypothetical protein C443_16556 [Haloarcula argentinensis DSM 12282]MDS0254262.1 DUF262 domain-containing HNH endonuclease family protein [Haloarcula argentinensis]